MPGSLGTLIHGKGVPVTSLHIVIRWPEKPKGKLSPKADVLMEGSCR